MKPIHVLFCGKEFPSAARNVARILAPHKQISVTSCEMRNVARHLPDADVAVPLMSRLDATLLNKAKKLRLIQQWGVGLEGVDTAAAHRLGIPVDNTPSTTAGSRSTAEMAVQLLLCALRQTPAAPPSSSQHAWGDPRGRTLSGKTVAIVGAHGKVGASLANMLALGFACKVLPITRSDEALASKLCALPPLDALVLACPLTAQTRGMVNDDALAQLPDDAVVVNVARGPLVDRAAWERHAARLVYATDVWFEEPPRNDDALRAHPRVITRQHVGGVSVESGALNDEECARKILAFATTTATQPAAANQGHAEFTPHRVHPPLQSRPSEQAVARVRARLLAGAFKGRGELLTQSASELEAHGRDESLHPPVPPQLVAYAESTDDVVACVDACRAMGVALVPFGAGTSLEGGVAALAGGLCVDLRRMDKVLELSATDMSVRVQAGVTRLALQAHLRNSGLMFPVDPGANAQLGGMAATRASGTTAVRWGTMRDRVAGLTCVLADGSVVRSGGSFVKSSCGYDMTAVMVGSEGTLGVITELQLKLVAVPEAYRVVASSFNAVGDAVAAVVELKQRGVVGLSRAELLDGTTVDALQRRGEALWLKPSMPCLLLELAGTPQSCAEDARLAREACESAAMVAEAEDDAQRARLWAARHAAYYASLALRPGCKGWPTDVCVPLSRLGEVVEATVADLKAAGLVAPLFGHVGDGNFHVILLSHADDGEAGLDALQSFNARLVERALAAGGTCTGEHGVGFGKTGWLAKEHGASGVAAMRRLKAALDPFGVFNPGKVLAPH